MLKTKQIVFSQCAMELIFFFPLFSSPRVILKSFLNIRTAGTVILCIGFKKKKFLNSTSQIILSIDICKP